MLERGGRDLGLADLVEADGGEVQHVVDLDGVALDEARVQQGVEVARDGAIEQVRGA